MVSVVIPVRNGAGEIGDQLEALARQDFDGTWEVVVSDNRSTDGTPDVVAAYASALPGLRVVSADERLGINPARNAGIRAARGDLILLCDADDVVGSGWVEAHAARLQEVDISAGLVDEETLNTAEVASFNSQYDTGEGCLTAGQFLPYGAGCNFGFRRVVWEEIDGFDDAWQRGGTEIEFCWRAQLAGFRIGWTPGAVVHYRHGSSIRSEVKRRFISARAMPRLYAAFQEHGMPGRPIVPALRAWGWLIGRVPWALFSRSWREKWLQVAAWRAGLAAGSIRYRVLYL